MHASDARFADAIVIRGQLVRTDRTLLALLTVIALGLLSVQLDAASFVSAVNVTAIGTIITSHLATRGRCWAEHIQLELGTDGIALTRSSGRTLHAEWSLFEDARLITSPLADDFTAHTHQLTLSNTFRPSIGSFLHTKSAERTIFYFPLVIEFDARMQEVNDVRQHLHHVFTM